MNPKVKVIDESGKVHHIPREVLEGRPSEQHVHVHIHVHGLAAILSDTAGHAPAYGYGAGYGLAYGPKSRAKQLRSQKPAKNRSKSKRAR
jgi:hypothetical protein